MYLFIYSSLHVSSMSCPSSGETNCINTASGDCHQHGVIVNQKLYWYNLFLLMMGMTC